MTIHSFKASSQHGDFKGTFSADRVYGSASPLECDITQMLIAGKIMNQGEALVKILLSDSTRIDGNPVVRFFIMESGGDQTNAAAFNDQEPVPVRTVDVDLSFEQFFKMFRNFQLSLFPRAYEPSDKRHNELSHNGPLPASILGF